MSAVPHTPTPWMMEINTGMGGPVTIVRTAAGKEVLAMYGAPKDIEHVFRAVNSHEALVKALQTAFEHIVNNDPYQACNLALSTITEALLLVQNNSTSGEV